MLAAGTHGRGAFTMQTPSPAGARRLQGRRRIRSAPARTIDYTITVKNIGNAAATGVTVTDLLPDNTTFVSAGQGGARLR